jgi:hypothetical protein
VERDDQNKKNFCNTLYLSRDKTIIRYWPKTILNSFKKFKMFGWTSKLSPLLKTAKTGNKSKLFNLVDKGDQDLATYCGREDEWSISWFEWKAHVNSWYAYIEGLTFLAECHNYSFSDENLNRKACEKLVESIKIQPISGAMVAFAYLLYIVNNFERAHHYLHEARRLDPYNKDVDCLLSHMEVKTQLNETKRKQLRVESDHNDRILWRVKVRIDPVCILSDELIVKIFSYLSVPELGSVSQVSKEWHRIAEDFSVWKPKYMERFLLQEDASVDFKTLYRDVHSVSKNWRFGKYTSVVLQAHQRGVKSLHYEPATDTMLTASKDRTIKVWSLNEGTRDL